MLNPLHPWMYLFPGGDYVAKSTQWEYSAGYTPSSMQDVGSFTQFLQAICVFFYSIHLLALYCAIIIFLPRFSGHDRTLCTVSDKKTG